MLVAGEILYDVYEVPGELLAILSAATLAVVTVAVIATRRSRLKRRKLRAFDPCHRCGFDLRATTGACPECGAPRPVPPVAKPRDAKDNLFDDFEDEPWHAS